MDTPILRHHIRDIDAVLPVLAFHLHLIVHNVHGVHGHALHPAIYDPFVSGIAETINQVVAHKSQYPDIISLRSCYLLFLGRVEIHDVDLLRLIKTGPVLPCNPASIPAYREAAFCKSLCNHEEFIAF